MDDLAGVGWLYRRAGFGAHPDTLAAAAATGVDRAFDDLIASVNPGSAPVDPWAGLDLDPEADGRREAVVSWVRHLFESPHPFVDRRAWMLHGWLVSSMAKVTLPTAMVDQIRLFMRDGGRSMPALLRAITIDPAMLVYLDGRLSTGEEPNENYGRELLELFALGIGNYTEDDVQAAARALTGWVVTRQPLAARFVPRRHHDAPVTLLGVPGVRDVDGVIDAVVAHPEHPRFVARRVAEHYLGDPGLPALDGVVDALADVYVDHDLELDAVVREALRLGLDGAGGPTVSAPIPWLVGAAKSIGVDANEAIRAAQGRIRELGQVPLLPPNVAGWPGGTEWFTTSGLIARTNVAAALAAAARPDEPVVVALGDDDLDRAARLLGLAEPFLPSTAAAIRSADDVVGRVTLALVAPEHLLA